MWLGRLGRRCVFSRPCLEALGSGQKAPGSGQRRYSAGRAPVCSHRTASGPRQGAERSGPEEEKKREEG